MTLFELVNNPNTERKPFLAAKGNFTDNMTRGFIRKLPNVEFGKTYYMVLQGALRAVRFDSVVHLHNHSTFYIFLTGTAAGLGKFAYGDDAHGHNGGYAAYVSNSHHIYACPEDYTDGDDDFILFNEVRLSYEDLFKFAFGNLFTYLVSSPEMKTRRSVVYREHYKQLAVRYKWTGAFVADAENPIANLCYHRLEVFPNGDALIGNEKKTLADFADYLSKTYATYATCKADNEVKVVEFEDDKPQQPQSVNVTIKVTPVMIPQLVAMGIVVVK